jgi:hypothetical protein
MDVARVMYLVVFVRAENMNMRLLRKVTAIAIYLFRKNNMFKEEKGGKNLLFLLH